MNVTLGSGKAVHAAHVAADGEVQNFPTCGGNKAGERYASTGREVTCKKCLKKLAAERHDLGYVHPVMNAPAPKPLTQADLDAMFEVPEIPAAASVKACASAEATTEAEARAVAAIDASTDVADLEEAEKWLNERLTQVSARLAELRKAAAPVVEKHAITGWPIFTVGPRRYAVSPRIQGPFGGVDSVKYFWVDSPYGQADQRNAYADYATGSVQGQLWRARYDFDMARQASH